MEANIRNLLSFRKRNMIMWVSSIEHCGWDNLLGNDIDESQFTYHYTS